LERIAIIGLGLIGGSLGLAIKRANLSDIEIAGSARTYDTVRKARKLGAIDVEADSAAEAARGARLVIIASPIMATRQVLAEIAPELSEGAVVTDVCSTKGDVAAWAKEILPASVHYVGGHPMAGKEKAGIDAADADLFRDKAWVIAPSADASEGAVATVIGLAQLAGAVPVFMDPKEHDSYVAAISHLPLLLSSALFSVAFNSAAWPELAQLASSGFKDTTRLASGSPEMAHDIMLTNRDNVVHWLDRYIEELRRYRDVIARGESRELIETFTRPQMERDTFVTAGPPKRDTGEPIETISISDLLFGTKVKEFMKKQEQLVRDMESRAEGKQP
jgi:prephenate dehydrogenase